MFLMRIVNQLLDVLFPPRPNEKMVRSCERLFFHPQPVSGTTTLMSFSDPAVRAAVTENKFHGNEQAARLLAEPLQVWLDDFIEPVVLVPIPLARARLKKRGYNQVQVVLSQLATKPVDIKPHLLVRTKDTSPQTSLTKTERIKNVANAFSVPDPKSLPSDIRHYILVDDVLTTGATMAAARAALTAHLPPNATLTCLALAH
jgi:ComF family protein